MAPFFPCSRSSAAGTNGGAIKPPLFPIEQALGIECVAQDHQQAGETAFLGGATVAVIDGRPWPVPLGNIAPLRTSMEFPEQAVEYPAMLSSGMATFWPAFGQVRFEARKLFISQFVSAHQVASFQSS